jgi:hypothetical protein
MTQKKPRGGRLRKGESFAAKKTVSGLVSAISGKLTGAPQRR